MEELEFDPNDFPSLDLAYDHIKGVLGEQGQVNDVLGSKAGILWAAATSVLGITVPVVLNSTNITLDFSSWPSPLLILAGIAYILTTLLAVLVIFPSRIGGISNPVNVNQDYSTLPRERFLMDMSTHIETQYCKNSGWLQWKGWAVRAELLMVLTEVGLLLAWTALLMS